MGHFLDLGSDPFVLPESPNIRLEADFADLELRMLATMCLPAEILSPPVKEKPKSNAERLIERAMALATQYPDGIPETAFKAFARTIEVEPMPLPASSAFYTEGPVHSREYFFCAHNRLYEECGRCLSDDCDCETCVALEPWIDF